MNLMAFDSYKRNIHYLRISLTDRCNLRCVYCMPEEMHFSPRQELLTANEILTVAQAARDLGFDKIRLTGGEPTVRPELLDIVRGISALGFHAVSMTTNGLRLKELARPLKDAGLERVNVSLDTLDPDKFHRITRWGKLEAVLDGIRAAEAAGLTPLKINAVVVRGYNDEDVAGLAALTLKHPWQVRFIEMMPFGDVAQFAQDGVVPQEEVAARIEDKLGPLEPVDDGRLDGEARLFRLRGAQAAVGFISTVTNPFCSSCSRVRLTADGKLRLCLLRDDEGDLRGLLRSGASLDQLKQRMSELIFRKPWGHGLPENIIPQQRVMSQIGG
jgi:cyclic pyranopterin phosphate synthase